MTETTISTVRLTISPITTISSRRSTTFEILSSRLGDEARTDDMALHSSKADCQEP